MSSILQKSPLPADWSPGNQDVVVGKGKKFFHHPGNVLLRNLVASMHCEYSKATTKTGKSDIISGVIDNINEQGHFVKRDPVTTKWVHADDRLQREKTSQSFRDNLCEIYRSSSVAKKNKRHLEQQQEAQGVAPISFAADDVASQATKKMRLEPPALQLVQPRPVVAQSCDWDMFMMTPNKIESKDVVSMEGNNLMSILSELINIPLIDEDDSNPFEPTPLSCVDLDLGSTFRVEAKPFCFESLVGGNNDGMYPSTYFSKQNHFFDDFPTLVFESGMEGDRGSRFHEDDLVSPNFRAAFAA